MTIADYRLPETIERGAHGGPDFKTVIQESISGKEQRIILWARCRASYDIAYSVLKSDDPAGNYIKVLTLFYGHQGKAYPFRFKAWNDYQANSEQFGVGDGTTTAFQLTKTYDPGQVLLGTPGARVYVRNIVLPVASSVLVFDNGAPAGSHTLGAGGVITFATAPVSSHKLTWTGEFDLPVRFDTDHLPVVMNEADLVGISTIPLREVIGEF